MGRKETGLSYLQEVLAKHPDQERAKAIITELSGIEPIVEDLGDNVLRQRDYTKGRGEIADLRKQIEAERAALETWRTNNLDALTAFNKDKAEFDAWVAGGKRGRKPTPSGDDFDGDDTPEFKLPAAIAKKLEKLDRLDALEAELTATQGNGLALIGVMGTLGDRFKEDFGKSLDRDAVFEHAKKLKTDVTSAYNDLFREQYEEKSKKVRDGEIEAAVKRGRDEALREVRSQVPYVVGGSEPGGTLTGLTNRPADPVKAALEAAMADHNSGKYRPAGAQ